ncbi:MAG: zf-HC2 domain-containing protein, partial [Ignavibacteria bacterium]|nr:zf-HC2 domain-containing protein [Ignavibacteria bacterium]
MSKEKIECKEVMKYVCQSLGDDLNSEKCAVIKAHLEECEDCKNYFKSVE